MQCGVCLGATVAGVVSTMVCLGQVVLDATLGLARGKHFLKTEFHLTAQLSQFRDQSLKFRSFEFRLKVHLVFGDGEAHLCGLVHYLCIMAHCM
jgi:hypothetical protein